MGKMLFGLRGIFCCNTESRHRGKLGARLSDGDASSSYNTSMIPAIDGLNAFTRSSNKVVLTGDEGSYSNVY